MRCSIYLLPGPSAHLPPTFLLKGTTREIGPHRFGRFQMLPSPSSTFLPTSTLQVHHCHGSWQRPQASPRHPALPHILRWGRADPAARRRWDAGRGGRPAHAFTLPAGVEMCSLQPPVEGWLVDREDCLSDSRQGCCIWGCPPPPPFSVPHFPQVITPTRACLVLQMLRSPHTSTLLPQIMTPNRACLALMHCPGQWSALVGGGMLGRARVCSMPPRSNTHFQVRECGRM